MSGHFKDFLQERCNLQSGNAALEAARAAPDPKRLVEARRACAAVFDAAVEAVGTVRVWSPNQLRHEGLTRVEEQFDLSAAQAVGGHTSPETTRVYISRRKGDRLAAEVAAKVG